MAAKDHHVLSGKDPQVENPVVLFDSMWEAGTSLLGAYITLADQAESTNEASHWLSLARRLLHVRSTISPDETRLQREALENFGQSELLLRSQLKPADGVPSTEKFPLTWLSERFEQRTVPVFFGDSSPSHDPVMVMVGGQPGAGKTRSQAFAQRLHAPTLTPVIGDDLRTLHPMFKYLQQSRPQDLPRITASVSGPMIRASLGYARKRRTPVLLEGTFRDSNMVSQTAEQFNDAGFLVHVIVLAVSAEDSWATAKARYEQAPDPEQSRWTPQEAHTSSVANLVGTVSKLSAMPAVTRVSVMNRSGELLEDSSIVGDARANTMAACLTAQLK